MDLDFSKDIVLENDRARLEPLALSHLEELLPIALNHPTLLQYSPSYFGSRDNLEKYIRNALAARDQQSRYAFAIFDKEKNVYAGSSSFGNISNHDQRLEIGWTWISKEFQGTGLNKNCKILLLKYAFEGLDFERVELRTDSRNTQSRRAIEKIGATYEGELRNHVLMLDGYRRSTVCYSIIKSEWAGIKNSVFSEFV